MKQFAHPRTHRLLDAAEYSRVFASNKRVSDRYWTILARRGSSNGPRLGLAIAKKKARRAVDRNRLKRLVRETFRHRQTDLAGLDIVVMNRDRSAEASNTELNRSLDKLWSRLADKSAAR